MSRALPGLAVWVAALALAWLLPGHLWHAARPAPFPLEALGPASLALGLMAALPPLLVYFAGPSLARRRSLSALEAPPDLAWALLLLALWPAAAGPPGWTAWTAALLAASLPSEARWLASALPPESPFPQAWGAQAARASRRRSLARLLPRWLAARLPLWLTASLVVERVFGLPGLGSDWMARVIARDHRGLALWILAFALLWIAARPLEREAA
ncbi:MAG TPA: hypothetical protein VL181_00995 [Holophagaceae bacterium]|nr:hypothetical protein [Holophagaceae bacterium]